MLANVFDHFCAGVNETDCLSLVYELFTKEVSSVIDYSIDGKEEEEQFGAVLEEILKLIEFAKEKKSYSVCCF